MHNHINVIVRCGGCGNQMAWCVQVERQVPDPIRCTPGPGRARSDRVKCSRCGRTCFERVKQLVAEVQRRASGGWGEHIQNGGVLINCQ